MQKVRTNYNDPRDSAEINAQIAAAVFAGLKGGLSCELGTQPDRVTIRAGKLLTAKGETITEDADLLDYFKPATGNEIPANAEVDARWDIIAAEFQYAESSPAAQATYQILEGTAGPTPALPIYDQFQTPVAVCRCPAGQQTYDLILPWPTVVLAWNIEYDHTTGETKVVDGNLLCARIQLVTKDFSDLFGWEPGLRVEMIAPGTKADEAVIAEGDWSLSADFGTGGERVIGDSIEQLGRIDDLHLWDDLMLPGLIKGGAVTNDGGTGVDVAALTILTRQYYRVANSGSTNLAVPVNSDLTYPRYDRIVARHNYTPPGAVPSISLFLIQGNNIDEGAIVMSDVPAAMLFTAANLFGSMPSTDVTVAYCRLEPGMQQYSDIVVAPRMWGYNLRHQTSNGNIIRVDSARAAVLAVVEHAVNATWGITQRFRLYHYDASGVIVALETSANGIIADVAEVVTARGSKASLDARLDVSLEEDGTLKDDSVPTDAIVDGAVDNDKLGDLSVDRDKVQQNEITGYHINSAVAGTALGKTSGLGHANALYVKADDVSLETSLVNDWVQVKDDGITTAKIADLNVTGPKLAQPCVNTDNVYDGAITTPKMSLVRARYQRTSGSPALSLIDGGATIVNFDSKVFDDPGSDRVTTGAAWKFAADRDMVVRISASLFIESTANWSQGEYAQLSIYKNGSFYSTIDFYEYYEDAPTTHLRQLRGVDLVSLSNGEYIDIRAFQNTGGNRNPYDPSSGYNHVSIEEI